jgi:hypothetical protein
MARRPAVPGVFAGRKLRKAKPLRGLARTRTGPAKAGPRLFNLEAFPALLHLLINGLPARRPAVPGVFAERKLRKANPRSGLARARDRRGAPAPKGLCAFPVIGIANYGKWSGAEPRIARFPPRSGGNAPKSAKPTNTGR